MRKQKISAILISAITLMSFTLPAAAIEAGFYFGGQVGESNTHNKPANVQTGTTPPVVTTSPSGTTGFAGRVFGGYQVNRYSGFEMGWAYFAPTTYNPSPTTICGKPQIRQNALDILGKGTIPFERFGLEGKAGVAYVRTSQSGSLGQNSTVSGCNGNNNTVQSLRPALGIGASYDITQNWQADVSWTRIFRGGSVQNIDFIALGISYHWVDKMCGQFLC